MADPSAFAAWRADQAREAWCVYAKPPANGPEVVLKYLARYMGRVPPLLPERLRLPIRCWDTS